MKKELDEPKSGNKMEQGYRMKCGDGTWNHTVNCKQKVHSRKYLVIFSFPRDIEIGRVHLSRKALWIIQMYRQASEPSVHSKPCRDAYLNKQKVSEKTH